LGDDYSNSSRLAALHVPTGEITDFGSKRFGRAGRWINDVELVSVEEWSEVEEYSTGTEVLEQVIQVWNVNVGTGATTCVKEYTFLPDESELVLRGGRYAMISCRGTSAEIDPTTGAYILDLDKGSRVYVPQRRTKTFHGDHEWNAQLRRLAYVTFPDAERGTVQLTVADAEEGVVARQEIPASDDIHGLRFSPDGKHLFYYHISDAGFPRPMSGRAEIWNMETGEIIPIRSIGAIGSIMAPWTAGPTPFDLPLWSPDGRYVAFPVWIPWRGEGAAVALLIADYGGWLAGRK
jgi:hypothetical protein